MILPTANGVTVLQSAHQSKTKLDKTQVGPPSACAIYTVILMGSSSTRGFVYPHEPNVITLQFDTCLLSV